MRSMQYLIYSLQDVCSYYVVDFGLSFFFSKKSGGGGGMKTVLLKQETLSYIMNTQTCISVELNWDLMH